MVLAGVGPRVPAPPVDPPNGLASLPYARSAAEIYERLLFHGSNIKNWVGILTRGILLPKIVVSLGVDRTDEGWLGSGI